MIASARGTAAPVTGPRGAGGSPVQACLSAPAVAPRLVDGAVAVAKVVFFVTEAVLCAVCGVAARALYSQLVAVFLVVGGVTARAVLSSVDCVAGDAGAWVLLSMPGNAACLVGARARSAVPPDADSWLVGSVSARAECSTPRSVSLLAGGAVARRVLSVPAAVTSSAGVTWPGAARLLSLSSPVAARAAVVDLAPPDDGRANTHCHGKYSAASADKHVCAARLGPIWSSGLPARWARVHSRALPSSTNSPPSALAAAAAQRVPPAFSS